MIRLQKVSLIDAHAISSLLQMSKIDRLNFYKKIKHTLTCRGKSIAEKVISQ